MDTVLPSSAVAAAPVPPAPPPPCESPRVAPTLSPQARAVLGDFEDKFVEVGTCASTGKRVTICYNAFGNPAHPCVLLIQGMGSSLLGCSLRFVKRLVDRGYYVIRYDNRDVGLSTRFDEFGSPALVRLALPQWMSIGERRPYVLEDIMEDAVGLLTALGVRQAHLFGGSMGGMIAQLIAIHHPERALSLSILATHAGGVDITHPGLWHYTRFLRQPRSDSIEDRAAHMLWLINYLSQGAYNADAEQLKRYILCTYERNGAMDNAGLPRQAAAVMRAASRAEGLRRVTCPALVIHGFKDPLIPVANAHHLADLLPNSKLVIFPQLGHNFPPELVDPIAEEVLLTMKLATVSS
ncbi:hydrolase, alpha/beta fold family [Novymonas esmeraldas]|uniref:Hydrolase, alpha/beta fold family n=1 Tax=Novymonas esmeraldas TaxID=1808958 RepID=A0AAW0EXF3_9TRYP